MKKYQFELAGNRKGESFNLLFARHRTKTSNYVIFHRNDFHTTITIPKDKFLEIFRYDNSKNIWRSIKGYVNLDKYMTVIDLRIK